MDDTPPRSDINLVSLYSTNIELLLEYGALGRHQVVNSVRTLMLAVSTPPPVAKLFALRKTNKDNYCG